jgi:peptide/nickel transport system substrate-binding protein
MVFDHLDFSVHHSGFDDGYNQWIDDPGIFLNYETRQAVAMCIDRQKLVDDVLDGYSVVLDSYVPPDHPLYNPDVTQYPYDPETAQANLEAFGWRLASDGNRYANGIFGIFNDTPLEISYYTSTNRIHSETSQMISEMLGECGVQVELIPLEPAEYYQYGAEAPLFGRNFDLAQYSWPMGIEPPCYLYLSERIPGDPLIYIGEAEYLHDINPEVEFYGQRSFPFGWGGWNTSGYASAEFDTACKAAMNSLPEEGSYTALHYLAQEIFAQDLPVLPLYMDVITAAARPDLCGFELDSTDPTYLWNLEEYGYDVYCGE